MPSLLSNGYGTTRFLSDDTFRNGQPSVVAVDIINFMDALKIDKAIIAGFDWGARTGDIMAVLWPERCEEIVSVSDYLIGSQESGKAPLPPNAEVEWWYQFYFATERGRAGGPRFKSGRPTINLQMPELYSTTFRKQTPEGRVCFT